MAKIGLWSLFKEKARDCGGRVVVQDPKTAEMPHMLKSALQEAPDAEIMTLKQIGGSSYRLARESGCK